MATVATQLNSGSGFASGEVVTATKLNSLVNTATVTGIVNADVDAAANISPSKLASGTLPAGITIASANITDGAVTGSAGGGKLAASAITSQTQLTDALASGDEFLVHDASATALRRVAFNAMQPAGSVLNTVQNTNANYTSITATISRNDTAPTSTSGTEILSQAITPAATANKVLVRFNAWGTHSGILESTAVICRGSTVIQVCSSGTQSNEPAVFSCEFLDSPSTASSVTYSVRIGVSTGTFRLNGTTARLFGGTSFATLTLQEIKG